LNFKIKKMKKALEEMNDFEIKDFAREEREFLKQS
jgi:hypothetical protein